MWRLVLMILTAFCALTATAGFVLLGPVGAPGWPIEYLEGTPFDSYLWPGVILLVAVGGTQLAAFVLLARRHGSAAFWAAVAGFAMVIWIIVEQLLWHVPDVSGAWITAPILQFAYSMIGLAELGCVLAMLGLFDGEHTRAAVGSRRG